MGNERRTASSFRNENFVFIYERIGEKDSYYRISKIYRNTIEKATGKILKKELILDNHSKVMYGPELIPKELIRI